MLARTRTAMKFFVYGLGIGVLFAPRSGKDSRDALISWGRRTVKETIGL